MADVKTKHPEVEKKPLVSADKYRNILLGAIGVVVLAAAGYFFYLNQMEDSDKEAQNEIYPAVYFFEQDSLDKALKGNGKVLGLLDIADKYAGTKTAKLAHFYIGVAYIKQAKFDDAIENLKEFSSNDYLLQARAYALIGDAYTEKENYEEAASYYKKAADYKPNEQYTPTYLMKLALGYELLKENTKATETYDMVINQYPKSSDVTDAKKYKARVETLATE